MSTYIPDPRFADDIDHCLTKRWRPAAANPYGHMPKFAPQCALCERAVGITENMPDVTDYCLVCPLWKYAEQFNPEQCGHADGRCIKLYKAWVYPENATMRRKLARRMVKLLEATRDHFFPTEGRVEDGPGLNEQHV